MYGFLAQVCYCYFRVGKRNSLTSVVVDWPVLQRCESLAGGADELATGTTQFVSGVKTVGSGMDQLNNGLMQLNTGMPQMEKQSSHLENGIAKLQIGSSQLENAVSSLNTKLTSKEAKAQTARLSEGLEQLKQGMTALTKAKIPALTNTLQTLNEQIATSQESIQSAVQTSDKEQTTLQEIDNLLADKSDLDADGMQALKAKLAVLKKQQGTTNQSVHQLQTNISTTKLTEQVRDVAQTAAALQAGYAGTDTQPGIYGGTKQLLTANQQIASAIGGSGKSILTGAAQLNQGLERHRLLVQAGLFVWQVVSFLMLVCCCLSQLCPRHLDINRTLALIWRFPVGK